MILAFANDPLATVARSFVPPKMKLVLNSETSSTLDDLLGNPTTHEGTPLTFEKGEFKSFLGFGESKINEIDAVTPYLTTQNNNFSDQPENLWQQWSELIDDNVFLDQQVTDLEFEDNVLTQLTLNGKTKLQGN